MLSLALVTATLTAGVSAHEKAAAPIPSGWDAAALTILVAGGVLYAVGSRRLSRRRARVRTVETASFWLGWMAVAAALSPPLDAAAAMRFSAHMAQHELLMLAGAPLMIVGRPIVHWLWAMPLRMRLRTSAGLQRGPVSRIWAWATLPLVAWASHGAAIWVWHLPSPYEAALRSESVHAVQHITFAGTAVLFWWGLAYGRYGRAAYGASALYVFTTMAHTGMLGALFALSTSPFYPLYAARATIANVDATVDQQLAGLVMWIPAGVVLTACGLGLVIAWIAEAERRAEARSARWQQPAETLR